MICISPLVTANIDNISFQPSGEDGVEINQGKGYTITITNPSPSLPMPVNISANTTLDIISDGVLFKTQTGSEVRFTFETIPEPDRYHLSLFNTSGSLIRNITDWHDLPEGVRYDPAVRTLSILPSVHENGSVHTYLLTIGRSDRNLTLVPAEKKGLFTLTGLPFLGFTPGLGQEISQESVSPVDQTDLDTHKSRFGRPDISITDISNLSQLRIRLDTSKSESPESKFRSDPENSGVYDDSGIRPSMTKVWEFRTGGGVSSSPTVAKGVVYIGCDDQNLYAIDAYTGEEKWRFRTGGGVSSSPDLTNGVVFFGSEDQYLYAVNATSGAEKWKFRTENMILSSPVVVNNVVYVGSEDQYLYAIDAGTGEEKWRFQANTTSSPAVVSGTVFFGGWNVSSGEHFVYAVNETTGTEKWKFRTGDGILSSPAVANGVVYVGSLDQFLYALDADTGEEKWRFQTGGRIYTTPAVANGVVYIGSDSGFMYAVDAKSGTRNWLYETGKEIRSSPAYANGRIYFGSLSQYLYVLDAMTGEEDWILLTGGDVSSSPAVADGMVYFGSGNSRVFAFGEKPFLQKIRDLFFIPGI